MENQYSLLFSSPPTTVMIAGQEVNINSDFRVSMQFEEMMQSNREPSDVIAEASVLYYGTDVRYLPEEYAKESIDRMIWFYRCGREEPKGSSRKGDIIYSFTQDDKYIYAAFMEQYGIELDKVEYLHWWNFRAMFDSLKEDQKIAEIMKIRAVKIDRKMPKEHQNYYREMKKVYALPKRKKKTDFENELDKILLAGGDPTALLESEGDYN